MKIGAENGDFNVFRPTQLREIKIPKQGSNTEGDNEFFCNKLN